MDSNLHALSQTYLESNACGLWNGSLKADIHRKLCQWVVAKRLDIDIDKASALTVDGRYLVDDVRKATLSLTDNLDDEIGFPLDKAPNYKRLVPLFADKFTALTDGWFDGQTQLLSRKELEAVLSKITEHGFSQALSALESYGFTFVGGSINKRDLADGSFLHMKSALGDLVEITPNRFFGCTFKILDPESQRHELQHGSL